MVECPSEGLVNGTFSVQYWNANQTQVLQAIKILKTKAPSSGTKQNFSIHDQFCMRNYIVLKNISILKKGLEGKLRNLWIA